MLKDLLYRVVSLFAYFHESILSLNNSYELYLGDKALHFIVIGILGMLIFLVVHPLVLYLARHGLEALISWFYTLTVIVVITFAIEIGQKATGTGNMEFADIVFGIAGFFLFSLIWFAIRGILRAIVGLFRRK